VRKTTRLVLTRPLVSGFLGTILAVGGIVAIGSLLTLAIDSRPFEAVLMALVFAPGALVLVGSLLRGMALVTPDHVRGAWVRCHRIPWAEIHSFGNLNADAAVPTILAAIGLNGQRMEIALFPFLTILESPKRHNARFEHLVEKLETLRPQS
jgi:hypothetical protein